MGRRIVALCSGGLCLLLWALLVACGSGDDAAEVVATQAATVGESAAPTETSPTARPSPVAAEETPTASPTASPTPTPEPQRLTLWTSAQGDELQLISKLTREAGQQADMVIEVVALTETALRVELLAADLAGGPLPDVIWGSQDDLAELLLDEQLQPIDMPNANDFLPALVAGATLDTQVWGVPLAARNPLLLLYNRALVQQPPDTTDALIVASRAFVTESEPDAAEDARYGLVSAWNEARWFVPWLNGFNGRLTTPDGTRPLLDTPEMVAALNLLRELYAAAPPEQQQYSEAQAIFAAGQAAFAIEGAWAIDMYRQVDQPDAALDLALAPLPQVPATGQTAAPLLSGSYLMWHRDLPADKRDSAQFLADYLTTPEVQERLVERLGVLPALRETLTAAVVADNEVLAVAAAQAEAAAPLPPTRAARCALHAIDMHIPLLLDKETEQDSEETASAMQQTAEQCLAP